MATLALDASHLLSNNISNSVCHISYFCMSYFVFLNLFLISYVSPGHNLYIFQLLAVTAHTTASSPRPAPRTPGQQACARCVSGAERQQGLAAKGPTRGRKPGAMLCWRRAPPTAGDSVPCHAGAGPHPRQETRCHATLTQALGGLS